MHPSLFFLEYASPMGRIYLEAEDAGLTRLWFAGQAHAPAVPESKINAGHPVLLQAVHWLELYFSGQEPEFLPPLKPHGTPFQKRVWQQLLTVPYGQTVAYSDLGSARAIGSAVGRNPIALMIPCHRVVGKNGCLTGYAGGLDRKIALLELEGLTVDHAHCKLIKNTG